MRKAAIGLCLLLCVVVLWVGSSTAIQAIFTEVGFDKPFFLTYFDTSMFSLYLISLTWKKVPEPRAPYLWSIAKVAAVFSPFWFVANYLFNISLGLTSVASNTILSTTSGLLTLILSIFLLKESPDIVKFAAAALSLGGVACIALSDENSGEDTLIGDILALGGAAAYAVYSVLLKKLANDVDMVLFFGFVGLINIVMFLPGFLIVNYSGLEPFEWPDPLALLCLILNAFFGTFVSDMLWALSVKCLNPALCTVGLSLTIPLSLVIDAVLYGMTFAVGYLMGALLVVAGFVVMSMFEKEEWAVILSNRNLKKKCCGTKTPEESELVEKSQKGP